MNNIIYPNKYTINSYNYPKLKSISFKNNETKKEKVDLAPLLGSIIGTGISSALVLAKPEKNIKLLKRVLNTDFATPKNIFILASGSILGGFIGGNLKDKGEDKWTKIKEANFQILSNVAGPLVFLTMFKKVSAKLTENSNKTMKNVGNFVSVLGGVATGAVVGSVIANKTNNLIHKEEIYERKLGVKDFLIHVDDIPIALAFAGIPFIDKLIPFILISRGYDVGKQGNV